MNAPPILVPIFVVGLVDVHWGYDLDFDPWPHEKGEVSAEVGTEVLQRTKLICCGFKQHVFPSARLAGNELE